MEDISGDFSTNNISPTDEVVNESSLASSQELTVPEDSESTREDRKWLKTRTKCKLTKTSPSKLKSPNKKIQKVTEGEENQKYFLRPRGRGDASTSKEPHINTTNKSPLDGIPSSVQPQTETPKPPPIFIRSVNDYKTLCTKLKNIAGDKFTCRSRFSDTVVYSQDSDTYRKIIHYLNEIEADFHCYQLKEEKSYRVVIRNLHHSTPIEDITQELKEKGYHVKRVHNAKHPVTKLPLPLFFVDLAKEEKSRDIYKESIIMYTRIKVEEPRLRRENITQCTKCMEYGHTHNYCFHTPKCVKCGEEHPSQTCRLPHNAKAKCANCQEDHPATYRGCKVFRAIKTVRSSNARAFPSSGLAQPSIQEQPPRKQYRKVNPGISYSSVATQQVPSPSLSNLIPTTQPIPSSSQFIPSQPLPQLQPRPRPPLSAPQAQPIPQIQSFDPSALFQSFFDKLEALITPLISLLSTFMQQCLPKLLK